MEICATKGEGGPMPNGKCHFKFPVFFNPSLSHSFCSDLFELTLAVEDTIAKFIDIVAVVDIDIEESIED